MKRFSAAALSLAILVSLAPAARAQEEDDEKERSQSFVIGLKTWYTSWESGGFEFDTTIMLGPTVAFRVNRFIVGGTFLTGLFSATGSLIFSDGTVIPLETDVRRNDLDVYVGYRIWRYINLAAGFKRITYDIDVDVAGLPLTIDTSLNNLVGGVNFARGFESGLFVSGGANLLYVIAEDSVGRFQGQELTEDLGYESNLGFNFEANVGYRIPGTSLSPLAGFRYQTITSDIEDGDDKFSGVTASVIYQF